MGEEGEIGFIHSLQDSDASIDQEMKLGDSKKEHFKVKLMQTCAIPLE